jgi:hypothetical protein
MTNDVPDQCLVGSFGLIHVKGGHATETGIVIDLRPRRSSDPPIVFASPLLAAQKSRIGQAPKVLPDSADRACAGSKKYRDSA